MTLQKHLVLHAVLGLTLLGAATAVAGKAPLLNRATPDNATPTAEPRKEAPQHEVDVDLLNVDFETGMPATWFLNTNEGSPGWLVDDAAGASSDLLDIPDHTQFAYCNSDAAGEGVTMDDYMISDLFDIPADVSAFMTFDYFFISGEGTSWYDFCDVLFSTNGGDWEILASLTDAQAWDDMTIDLTEFAGSNMCQIAFRFWDDGTWAWGVGIDNVHVFTTVGDEFPPEITAVPYYNHLDFNSAMHFEAEISDPSGVANAQVMYRTGPGDWISVEMMPVAGDTWEADVPGIGSVANMEWRIAAMDFSSNSNMTETESFFTEVNNEAWLHNDLIGESTNGLGLVGAWTCAAKFDPGVYPITLTQVETGMFLNGGPADMPFNLKIYNANGTGGNPGTVLSTQAVTLPNAEMGVLTLTAPVEVSGPFYVGLEIPATGGYVYTDNVGHHFPGMSMLALGGTWQTVESAGFPINWILHVFAEYEITTDVAPRQVLVPNGIELLGSYPNPFNPSSEISFRLNQAQPVSVEVFNLQGAKVRTLADQVFEAGEHSLTFDAADLASGMYVAVLKSGMEVRTLKLSLVR